MVCVHDVKLIAAPDIVFHERVFIFSLQENPSATLTMSLAQTNFCRKHGFDPQSPLCAHIILSGTVTKVRSYCRNRPALEEPVNRHLVNSEGETVGA